MASRNVNLDNKTELLCPICRIYGECSTHCVEMWENDQRPDHLALVLEGHADAKQMYELLSKRYPTLESCFEGIVLVSWEDDPPAQQQPLFTGELVYGSSQLRKWTAVFHQEGPQLLQHYHEFILSQLNKPQHIQRILKVIRKHHTTKSAEKTSFSEIEQQMTFSTATDAPAVSYFSPSLIREPFPSLTELIDPDELMSDLMVNLT